KRNLPTDDYSGACFFFSSRRRHTRFSRDWSSDVCSSDLKRLNLGATLILPQTKVHTDGVQVDPQSGRPQYTVQQSASLVLAYGQIGRASCRERAFLTGCGTS